MNFDEPDIMNAITLLSSAEIDTLPFGLIGMAHDGIVTIYSAFESQMAGISEERVVGLNFFTDVAPCTNNYMVAGRYDEAELDETIDYVFTLRMKPTRVKLRMLKSAASPQQYLLVKR